MRIYLNTIFEHAQGVGGPVPAPTEPTGPTTTGSTTLARWEHLVVVVNEQDQQAAQAFVVQRARRIWGKLGNLLRRSLWAQAWRAAHMVPYRVLVYVKRWYYKRA